MKYSLLFIALFTVSYQSNVFADSSRDDVKKITGCAGYYQAYYKFRSDSGDVKPRLLDMTTQYLFFSMYENDKLENPIVVNQIFENSYEAYLSRLKNFTSDEKFIKFTNRHVESCEQYMPSVAKYTMKLLKSGLVDPYELFPSKAPKS